MHISGNTILITGGGSGIGLGLASAFHALGNDVIIAGRRRDVLDKATAANPGMASIVCDIGSSDGIASLARRMEQDFPALNVVVHNAGIMMPEVVADGHVADAEAMVATNLLAPIRLTAALLPRLLAQPHATIMTVSSGLAFLPLAATPTYCATKAAIHSWSQSLRHQLKGTSVRVMELAPPYVQTELMGASQAHDPRGMPLVEFIAEVMALLKAAPDAAEICVERVKPLRHAEASGNYDTFYRQFNDAMAGDGDH